MKPRHKIFRMPYKGGSRFATPSGRMITPDSPLKPFRDAGGEFHTTKSVANIKDLDYSYYGLEHWAKTEKQISKEAVQLINRLYGDNPSEGAKVLSQGNGRRRYLVNIRLDVAELKRPASVNVYVSGLKAGGIIVMAQPRTGILHGAIPLDDALQAAGLQRSNVNEVVNSIQSSITVTITKVGVLIQGLRNL
jgi:tyrosinase